MAKHQRAAVLAPCVSTHQAGFSSIDWALGRCHLRGRCRQFLRTKRQGTIQTRSPAGGCHFCQVRILRDAQAKSLTKETNAAAARAFKQKEPLLLLGVIADCRVASKHLHVTLLSLAGIPEAAVWPEPILIAVLMPRFEDKGVAGRRADAALTLAAKVSVEVPPPISLPYSEWFKGCTPGVSDPENRCDADRNRASQTTQGTRRRQKTHRGMAARPGFEGRHSTPHRYDGQHGYALARFHGVGKALVEGNGP